MLGIATSINQTPGQSLRVPPTLIELSNGQQPGVTADLLRSRLDNDRLLWEKIKLKLIHTLFKHHAASVRVELRSDYQVRTHEGRFFKSCVNNPG